MPSQFVSTYLVCRALRPPAEGLLFAPCPSLFSYSRPSKQAARTQNSAPDKFLLYSENAVVLSHPLATRKTSQLDKPDTQSHSLKRGKQLISGRVTFCQKELSLCCFGVSQI